MLDELREIEDPILRAETAGELLEELRQVRDGAICEAHQTLSVRAISDKIGLSKSSVHAVVRASRS